MPDALEAHAALVRLTERLPATPDVGGWLATVRDALPSLPKGTDYVAPAPIPLTDHDRELSAALEAAEAARLAEAEAAAPVEAKPVKKARKTRKATKKAAAKK